MRNKEGTNGLKMAIEGALETEWKIVTLHITSKVAVAGLVTKKIKICIYGGLNNNLLAPVLFVY